MKKIAGKMFKRIVSTALVATLTLGAVYMSYTSDGNNTNVVETERVDEQYVVQDEEIDLQCSDSEVDQEVVKSDDSDTLAGDNEINTNGKPQNSVSSSEKDATNVNVDTLDSTTIDLPEVIESEIKKNEIYILSAGVSDETENDILLWEERNDISSTDIYARYDETGFKRIANVTDTEYEVDLAADYRIVANTVNGEKIGSNVITLVESEDGYLYEDVVDTDEDDIPDGYEYLIGTNANAKDSDNDGFIDGYEVFVLCTNPAVFDENDDLDGDGLRNLEESEKGTNPYLKDSDFDGIKDNTDVEPLKTNVDTGMEVEYTIPVKTGMFDLVSTYVDENGNNCELVYNYLNGQIKYISDSENERYSVYNEANQLVAAVEYVDEKIIANTYSYKDGNIETITHNGFQYAFTYDENGNMVDVKVGERTLITNQYDEDVLLSETYGNGHTNKFVYDEYGNVISQKTNGIIVYEWQYDEEGNVITYKDVVADEVHSYTYDENGNLTGIRSESGFCIGYKEEENSYTISYEYAETTKTQTTTQTEETDENGDITKNITTTNLISGGKLTTVISEEDSTERTLYVNGAALLSSKYTSSDKGITKIEYQDGKILEYDYDEIGNIVSVTENGELKLSYEYDSLGQLVRENNLYAGKSYTYIYDNAGNILESKEYAYSTEALTETESVKTYEYNDSDWKDLLTSFNGQAITYDEIGNPLTYRDGMTFSWAGRQLCTVNIGGDMISYTYNSNGIRTSKTLNGITTTYQLDGTKIVAETTENITIWYIYDNDDRIIGFEYEGQTYYFEKSIQGDVLKIYDESGAVVSEYIYDAWGNIVAVYGDEDIAKVNPFRYRGYYQDNETGFYYLQSRYYDSQIGRFLNADASMVILLNNSIIGKNLFSYCYNNPINYSDDSGYLAANIVGAVIGAIIGIVGGNFLGNWLADILNLQGWERSVFVTGISALVGATAAAIGYFIGPYVAKVTAKLAQYVLQLLQNGKITFGKLTYSQKTSVRSICNLACFVEGTKVATEDGSVAIEMIKEGDLVWAENVQTGECGYKKVIKTFVNTVDTVVSIWIEGHEIITTEEHPFWINGNGWTAAGELKEGDLVKTSSGELLRIQGVKITLLSAPINVYNFEVQDWHTYFVGEKSILVHNQCAKDFVKASRTPKEVIKFLQKNGFSKVSQTGSHVKLCDGIKTVVVPNHSKDLGKGLLHTIMKEAGLL